MKKAILALLAVATLAACAEVPTGSRGVVLSWSKPTGEVKSEGLYGVAPFTGYSIVEMNVQQQTDNIDVSVLSHDGQHVDASVSVMYNLDPGKVVGIYDRLRNDYQARVIDPTVRSAVRDAVGQYKYLDLVANQGEVQRSIDKVLRAAVEPQGIIIDNVYLTKVAFDPSVQDAIENTVKAKQELMTAQINAQKAKADAQGIAAAQQAQHLTLTPLLLQKELLDKWDGHLPQYIVNGGSQQLSLMQMIGGSH